MHFTVVLLVFLILTTSFAFSATTTTTTTTTFSRRRPEAVSATAQEEEPASSSSTTTTPSSSSRNTAAFMENWQVLGPFPVGSRELGYDPLAAFYGGFENIPYSEKDEYPSEICEGGYVKWSLAKGISSSSSPSNGDDNTNQHVIEVGPINYAPQTTIKWDFNSAPFGWVARHHYTYARSTFETSDPGVYLATFSNVVSFKIDNQSFPGNIYNYQHASKSAVWLEPGMHDIYVCIIWDIRVNGGGIPAPSFYGSIVPVEQAAPHENAGIVVFHEDTIVPELMIFNKHNNNPPPTSSSSSNAHEDGEFSFISRYVSITILNTNVAILQQPSPPSTNIDEGSTRPSSKRLLNIQSRNAGDYSHMAKRTSSTTSSAAFSNDRWKGWVQILAVKCFTNDNVEIPTRIPVLFTIKVCPGQIYPIAVELITPTTMTSSSTATKSDSFPMPKSLTFEIMFLDLGTDMQFSIVVKHQTKNSVEEGGGGFELVHRTWGGSGGDGRDITYKMTFLGYDGAVQYAMVRPPFPAPTEPRPADDKFAVLIALHGAGVEASSEFWLNAYKPRNDSWTLFPTGRTPWGFDWHGPSHKSILSALETLEELAGVPASKRDLYSVDITKLIYSGHSNGGQGAWWLTGHYPDNAVAAVPASGYLSVQFYTPYFMRSASAFTDPILRGILEASIAENDIDLYAANMQDIPILARTGSADDNVPPLHTRKIVRLLNQYAHQPKKIRLSEIPGQGHWFEGVVDDPEIELFLNSSISGESFSSEARGENDSDDAPIRFSLVTLNPASSGPKNGIRVLQLTIPFRLGKISVEIFNGKMVMKTENIRRFQFVDLPRWKKLLTYTTSAYHTYSEPSDSSSNVNGARYWRGDVKSWEIDETLLGVPPQIGPSYVNNENRDDTWKISTDLLWLSDERHSSTYGPAFHVFLHEFVIVIPSEPSKHEYRQLYFKIAQHIASSWYLFGRGGCQILYDDQVLDGDAARYNMIVLGGADENKWTKRRESEGTKVMVKFLQGGGFGIGNRKYTKPGTGIIFLGPNPTRTRLGLFIAGTDMEGFLRAAWTIPFRTGLMVPDYLIVGEEYGDPATGWTNFPPKVDQFERKRWTKGSGGILAAGYWSNTWEYDDRCGYLK